MQVFFLGFFIFKWLRTGKWIHELHPGYYSPDVSPATPHRSTGEHESQMPIAGLPFRRDMVLDGGSGKT
jgi:hypothetical protein